MALLGVVVCNLDCMEPFCVEFRPGSRRFRSDLENKFPPLIIIYLYSQMQQFLYHSVDSTPTVC